MKYIITAFACFFMAHITYAQSEEETDTTQFSQYIILQDSFDITSDIEAKKTILNQLFIEADRIDDDSLTITTYTTASKYYMDFVSNDSALAYLDKAKSKLLSNTDPFHIKLALIYGEIYDNKGDLEKSQKHYLYAIDFPAKGEYAKSVQLTAYFNIATLYTSWGYDSLALKYLNEGSLKNPYGEKHMKSRHLFHNLGLTLMNMELYDSALVNYNKAITGLDSSKFEFLYSIYYNNTGICYQNTGRYQKAQEAYMKSLSIRRKSNNQSFLASVLINLGSVALDMEQPQEALKYALECMQISKKMGDPDLLRKANKTARKAHILLSNYDSAVQYLLEELLLMDSTFNINMHQKVAEVEVKYESEKKAAENELLKKDTIIQKSKIENQQLLIFFMIFGVAVLSIVAYLIYTMFKRQKTLTLQVSIQKDEIEKQREQLQKLDTFKSRFFANVSHDLRTPLTLIQGRIKQLQEDKDSYYSNRAEITLQKLQHDNTQLLSFSEDIRQLIELEEDKLTLQYNKVDSHKFFTTIFKMFSSFADLRKIKYHFSANIDDDNVIHLDINNMQKVMYNLISNAFKFTAPEDEITIHLEQKSKGLNITIKDTGIGISKENQQHVFERYYQANNDFSNKQGLGIGLSLVQEIITLHHGTIKVKSKPNKGSEFTIHLPYNLDQELSADTNTSFEYLIEKQQYLKERDLNTGEEKNPILLFDENVNSEYTVLIVDDHAEIRAYISDFLKKDYKILQAKNGKHALQILQKHKVNIIITDLMMPWMDGYEFIEKLKQNTSHSNIPIMVVSARVSESDKNKVLEYGVNNFISKPFDQKELELRVHNLIHNLSDTKAVYAIKTKDGLDDVKLAALERLNNYILDNLDKEKISSDELAEELYTSNRNLYRLIKELTGKTPLGYLKDIRFQYVFDNLKKRHYKSLSEAAVQVGIKNVTEFKKQFVKRFGIDPSTYID